MIREKSLGDGHGFGLGQRAGRIDQFAAWTNRFRGVGKDF